MKSLIRKRLIHEASSYKTSGRKHYTRIQHEANKT